MINAKCKIVVSALPTIEIWVVGQIRLAQSTEGIPKGEAARMLVNGNPIRFPFGPPGESEDHAEGSRRLFAYFLVGEKV